jgi:hypothetical protein
MGNRRLPFLLLVVTVTAALSGCSRSVEAPVARARCDAGVGSLLVSESTLPLEWKTEGTSRPVSHQNATHRCGRSFSVTNGVAFHDIYEYTTPAEAEQNFARQKDRFFASDEFGTAWEEPSFASRVDLSSADDYYLACRWRSGRERCQLLAQFGRFTTVFYSHMSSHYMSGDDFVQVVQAILGEFGGSVN